MVANVRDLMGKGSAGASQSRVEELRFSVNVSHFVTITFNARIYLTLEIFLVNVTHRLLIFAEVDNLQHQTAVDRSISKLDGIEVNNHVAVFGSQLHCGEISQHGQDTRSGWVWRKWWTAHRLSHGLPGLYFFYIRIIILSHD